MVVSASLLHVKKAKEDASYEKYLAVANGDNYWEQSATALVL